MILKDLHIKTFAATTRRNVTLQPGMNVLSGPNEAGKSTIVKSVKAVLLEPVNLSAAKARDLIADWLPLGGGDSVEVELGFEIGDESYAIRKLWGPRPEARLTMPGGEVLSCPIAVQQALQSKLPAQPGTIGNVLITPQGHLHHVFGELSEESETTQDLAGLLRTSFATDGVRLETLGTSIRVRVEKLTKKWDFAAGAPERDAKGQSKEVDRQWANGRGDIITAYYIREEFKRSLANSEDYEERAAALNKEISEVRGTEKILGEKVELERPIVQDLRKLGSLNFEKAELERKSGVLTKISRDWPTHEERVRNLTENKKEIEDKLEAVDRELATVERYRLACAAKETLDKLREKDKEIKDVKDQIAGLTAITAGDLKSVIDLDSEKQKLTASLEAARLRVRFVSSINLALEVMAGVEEGKPSTVLAGHPLEIEAGGSVVLKSPDWEIQVRSGEIDFEGLQLSIEEVTGKLDSELKAMGARDIAEASRLHAKYEEQCRRVERLEIEREGILDGREIKDLKDIVSEFEGKIPPRPQSTLLEEKGRLCRDLERLIFTIKASTSLLKEWLDTYGDWNELQLLIASLSSQINEVNLKLQALSQEARDMKDPEVFVNSFERAEAKLRDIKDRLRYLEVKRADLEKEAPEMSSEEIQQAIHRAEHSYQQFCREAQAMLRLQEEFQKLRDELDAGTLSPWIDHIGDYIRPSTARSYERLDWKTGKFVRADGLPVPFRLLSQGTQATLGIAVRLSMAKNFIGGSGGFLILDDPLVDLDPERQAEVVKMLRQFSANSQVIIATCHPAHAELLGGNIIDLEGPAKPPGQKSESVLPNPLSINF